MHALDREVRDRARELSDLLVDVAEKQYGFLLDSDVELMVDLDRLRLLLVQCGACRFLCPAQDVKHLVRCVQAGGDYVRDVSLPARGVR